MIRKVLFSMSLLSAGLCMAAPLSPEQALQRLDSDNLMPATRTTASPIPVMTMATAQGEPSIYVFNRQEISGFMIVSADDAIVPLLGYSDSNFDPDNISPAMQDWLEQYNAQIEYARKNPENGVFVENTIQLPSWAPIEPLVKTKWNQNSPYYNMCPKYNNAFCNTGCVATAMSQVMKYWNYPAKGQGSITYECESLGRYLTADFSKMTFDWANMLNNYNDTYTEVESNAVAQIMMAAGYSVRMSYSTGTSGAVSGLISGALVNYFDYDESAYYAVRDLYTYSDWAALIYDNLQKVGPVIYDGNSSSVGHSFVCDGYQGNGYFHFNWGWGGSGDGYFLLDALNPSSLGIGGGGGGGFNLLQDAILNIKPADNEVDSPMQDEMVIYGSVLGVFSNNLLNFDLTGKSFLGWSFKGLDPATLNLGAIFEPADGSGESFSVTSTNSYNIRQLFDPISYMPLESTYGGQVLNLRPTFKMSAIDLEKGVKYKVSAAYNHNGTSEWKTMNAANGSYSYFYITKTGDGTADSDYTIENFYPMQFTCTGVTFNSTLYNGIAADVTVNIENDNDTELTRGVTLQLYDSDGKLRYVGDSFVVSLAPGEKITQNWLSVLTAQTSTTVARALPLYVAVYDPETNTEYYRSETPVEMQANPGRAFYTTELSIENAELVADKYQVKTSADFNVVFTVDVTRNIFSIPMTLWIASMSGNQYSRILVYPLDPMVVEAGETYNVVTNMSFPDAKIGETYYIVSLVEGSTFDNAIPFVAMSNQAGVEELIVDNDAPLVIYDKAVGKAYVKGAEAVEVYSLNGMKLSPAVEKAGGSATVDLSGIGKGIVILKATDAKGNTTSRKLAL